MNFLHRIWQMLQGNRGLMAWSVFFGLMFTGLGIVPPLLVGRMIRWLDSGAPASAFFLLGLLLFVVFLLRGITRYLYGLMSHVAAYRTLFLLMNRTYRHLQRMSPAYVNRRHTGNLVARTVGDVEAVEDFIAHGIPETMLAIVIPLTMGVVLLIINWKLALISLVPLPFVAGLVYVISTRVRNHWSVVRGRFADVSALIQDHLAGLTAIQSFVREAEQARRVERESAEYRDLIIHANRWSLVPAGIVEAASGGGLVLIVCAGAWMTGPVGSRGVLDVDVADLVVFLMYLGQIFLPFLRLAGLTENLQKAAASAERVFELLDTPPPIIDGPDVRVPTKRRFDVAFDRVDFSFQAGQPVLQGVSFHVQEGESVALVGMTGVGKTTACHLLVRFYDVDGGCIRLGGHDIRSLPLAFLRQHVALVSQDVFLFQGTIRDNLLLGNPLATESQIREAVATAHADEFIAEFPRGFETLVGERGVRLSGGQKQRLAIARAVLKDAPVLLLDEATSAVDPETESLIKDALTRVTHGRTVLIVAHRRSTIMSADRLIVLDAGRVIATGTWDELSRTDGRFVRLCQLREDALL